MAEPTIAVREPGKEGQGRPAQGAGEAGKEGQGRPAQAPGEAGLRQDWQMGRSLDQCCLGMFERELFTDVTFVIGKPPSGNVKEEEQDDDDDCDEDDDDEEQSGENLTPVQGSQADTQNQDTGAKEPDSKRQKSQDGGCVPSSSSKAETNSGYAPSSSSSRARDDSGDDRRGEWIRAHRFILIARSPVFEAMFSGAWAEQASDVIRITDCAMPEAFREMLRFIYSDEVDLNDDIVMSVLYQARKYMLPGLVKKCLRYVKHTLNHEANLCSFLEQACANREGVVLRTCIEAVRYYSREVLTSQGFLDLSMCALCCLLHVDSLTVSEETLFTMCHRWAVRQCQKSGLPAVGPNLLRFLGACLYRIQFQNMAARWFTKNVVPKCILPQSIVIKFYEYFTLTDYPSSGESDQGDGDRARVPEGFSSGRVLRRAVTAYHKPIEMFYFDNDNINYGLTYACSDIRIKPSVPIRLTMLKIILGFDPEVTVDGETDVCHLEDYLDTVKVNGVPCCKRISYSSSKGEDGQPIENEQLVYIYLSPAVEVKVKGGTIEMALSSRFRMALLPLTRRHLTDDNDISVSVRWKGYDSMMPFPAIGFTIAR